MISKALTATLIAVVMLTSLSTPVLAGGNHRHKNEHRSHRNGHHRDYDHHHRRHHHHHHHNGTKDFLLGAAVGGVLGAVVSN